MFEKLGARPPIVNSPTYLTILSLLPLYADALTLWRCVWRQLARYWRHFWARVGDTRIDVGSSSCRCRCGRCFGSCGRCFGSCGRCFGSCGRCFGRCCGCSGNCCGFCKKSFLISLNVRLRIILHKRHFGTKTSWPIYLKTLVITYCKCTYLMQY